MFNIKEFLIENRITTASRLDEAEDFDAKYMSAMGKLVPNIGKWKLDTDEHGMMGTWSWSAGSQDYDVYATPWWEGSKGVTFELYARNSDNVEHSQDFPLKKSGNPKIDAKAYKSLVQRFLNSTQFKQMVQRLMGM